MPNGYVNLPQPSTPQLPTPQPQSHDSYSRYPHPHLPPSCRFGCHSHQSLARQLDIGLFFTNMEALGEQLRDKQRMTQLRNNVWHQREQFMFDYHADRLINFFREVIGNKTPKKVNRHESTQQ